MKRFLKFVVLLLAVLALGAPAFAQEKTNSAAPPAKSAEDPERSRRADAPKAMPVPAEIQELLADRELLSAEIERIISAEGEVVKIPVSLRKLSARREAKSMRYAAWLDANKIPREWGKAGWSFDGQQFLPPAPEKQKEKP